MAELSGHFGAGEWARTIDLLITNQLLYQLSYAGQGGKAGPLAELYAASRNPPCVRIEM